ncbi:MAG: polyprenyl synthetase family protein [Syntrophorhabdaceae bacterium]|nr:polyprenyl synthetase family protein [Syntrophorhabdales bacterium]MBP9561294.1 polyprenyl synthetase family protein [Syntrophorhabdaceae bacterium]
MEKILKLIEKDFNKLELAIDSLDSTDVKIIKKIVNHIIKSGGKRVRPILVILTSKLCGFKGQRHIKYAAVIEFIHTATLLHDDVIDNAELRRGSSTVNTLWGNEASVLVGDFLYSKSFELMSKDGNSRIIEAVSRATTILSEGEILELLKTSDPDTTEDEYFEIVYKKTAILFSAACEIGAILARADTRKKQLLKEYGKNLGVAFQLVDDLLDYTSYDNKLGKQIGTDLKEGKVTLPLIHTLRSADAAEKELIKEKLAERSMSPSDFEKIKGIMEKYGSFEYTYNTTRQYIDEAKRCLDAFGSSRYKDALLSLTDMMLTRMA